MRSPKKSSWQHYYLPDRLGHETTQRVTGILDGLQNKYPDDTVLIGIRIGGSYAYGVPRRKRERIQYRQASASIPDPDAQDVREAAVSVDQTILDYEGIQGILPTRHASRRGVGQMDKWFLS